MRGPIDSALDTSQAVSKKTVDGLTSAVDQVEGIAGKAMEMTTSAPGKLKSLTVDRVFSQCPVPTFMLPTGPSAEHYALIFHLDDLLDSLKTGILVRPKIEVWTGREGDYDLDHFGQELVQDFSRQFNEARDSLIYTYKIDDMKAEENRLSKEIWREAYGPTLSSAARWLIFPPISLVLLGLGMRPRTELLKLLSEYFSTRRGRSRAESELKRELKALESKVDTKSTAFKRAIKNIEVRVHPQIQSVVRLICDAEGVGVSQESPAVAGDIPDARPYLHHPSYLERLPPHYRALIDSTAIPEAYRA